MQTNFFVITIVLPETTEQGDVVNDNQGKPIYRTNYFCKLDKDTIPGAVLNEWDTDKRYAYRFADATTAENFRRVVLESLEGTEVIECKPDVINGKVIKLT